MNDHGQLKKGSIQTLILAVVADSPRHGYAIAREIERRSGDILSFREGTLYPALAGLEQAGWIVGTWQIQASGPARKIYEITEDGRAQYEKQVAAWEEFSRAVTGVIGRTGKVQPA